MSKIDTSGWRIFRVEELFETEEMGRKIQVPTGSWIASKNLMPGSTPRITVSGVNNGITGYYKDVDDANYRVYKNFISVSFLGTVFYQASRASLDMKVHCLKPLNIELNERVASFLVTMIKAALGSIEYSDQISSTVLPSLELMLPVDASGDPNWAYMDEYMSAVMGESGASLENMGKVKKEFHPANASDWRQFSIGSLFEIEKGTRLTRAAMIEGDTPFIGATLENNGITARVSNIGHVHPGGLMTVAYNGQKATGKAFYQPIPFWASDDVNVLYPKFSLTEYIALFLAPLFWEAGRPYSFGDKWGKDVMESDYLTLPANASGEPDWDYMDKYMRTIMESAKSDLAAMQSIRQ